MLQPLDGPSTQLTISVNTTTVKEMKTGGSVLPERQAITFQPKDGKIFIYFGDGINTPNAATLLSDGIECFKKGLKTIEASDTQPVFMLAVSGTVNVVITERS